MTVRFLSALALFSIILPTLLHAQAGDTVVVQAFTFEDTTSRKAWGHINEYEGMVNFPEEGGRYEKIIMVYTLKCDAATTADRFGCGEWDYSTFTRVWENDSTLWEIGRFITPYGIGLDLGPDGFTWHFDVSDYAPILTGQKMMTAGNNQELLDLKFLFITGTPARDPISVTRLWTHGNKNYKKVTEDSVLAPIAVTLDPEAVQYRINTRPQGGNFNGGPNTDNCSEFCDRVHSLAIDGTTRFEWNVWNECGDNPVYPQGGTWLYDRAGWCPGAGVTTQHHELTPYVTPGATIEIDYDIENPSEYEPYGHWVFWADLVAYGPTNFDRDAGVERIVSPSTADEFSRMNPTCAGPVVDIVNRGSDAITSMTISYGFEGMTRVEYNWTGSIDFLASERVDLPALPFEDWVEGPTLFEVEIVSVNGDADEYESNDYAMSAVDIPPRLPSRLTIQLQTNQLNAISTSDYLVNVYDADGAAVFTRDQFPTSALVEMPLDLPDGCYVFELVNPEGLGLDFWPIRDRLGTGSVRIVDEGGSTVRTFEPDFGNRISFAFTVPAPAAEFDQSALDFGPAKVGDTVVRVLPVTAGNALGLWVRNVVFFSGGSNFKITDISPAIDGDSVWISRGDTMKVTIEFRPTAEKKYTGRMLLTTNDARGVLRLEATGTGDNSIGAVATRDGREEILGLELDGDSERLAWRVQGAEPLRADRVTVHDARGRTVLALTLDEGSSGGTLDIADLASGVYFLSLTSGDRVRTASFTVAR